MNENYYKDLDLNYVEIATAAKKFHTTDYHALFYIPVLMPLVKDTDVTHKKKLPASTNILNKDKPIISSNAYTSGAISIPIHRERLGNWYENIVPKGTKFMVVFVGGDINKPRILGRY